MPNEKNISPENPKENVAELQDKSHVRISPTAYGVAFRRTLAEIEYAEEIYEELERLKAGQTAEDIAKLEKMKAPETTPFFEARYKLVNKLLKESGTEQVLEVAAGLSPRGFSMTTENPNFKYVELDLEQIIGEKEQIHSALAAQGKLPQSPNHHLEKGDALNLENLRQAVRHFDKKPIAIINEGLMRYLTFEQKAQYAKNVDALLEEFGGVWITPDITLKSLSIGKERAAQVSKDLSIDVDANLFENEAEARKFFENLGFTVESHSFREIENELVSPGKLKTTPEQLADMLDKPVLYVMKVKT
jgi:O-methyltransferase involved in polyketide biosynthesis